MNGLIDQVGYPTETWKSRPWVCAMIMDRRGKLTAEHVRKLGLHKVDLKKISTIEQLEEARAQRRKK